MHTPDDPTSTAKRRQTCTHPGTISATQTCNAAIHGPSKHLIIAMQIQRATKTGFYYNTTNGEGDQKGRNADLHADGHNYMYKKMAQAQPVGCG